MGALGYVVGGAALGLIMALYVTTALGTPVLSGVLGCVAARRTGCIVRAGITALFAVGVPLGAWGIAKTCLTGQSLAQGFIRSLMLSTAFLFQLPTFLFEGMYDRQAYGNHALVASAAVIFAIIWLSGAIICAWQRGRAGEHQPG